MVRRAAGQHENARADHGPDADHGYVEKAQIAGESYFDCGIV